MTWTDKIRVVSLKWNWHVVNVHKLAVEFEPSMATYCTTVFCIKFSAVSGIFCLSPCSKQRHQAVITVGKWCLTNMKRQCLNLLCWKTVQPSNSPYTRTSELYISRCHLKPSVTPEINYPSQSWKFSTRPQLSNDSKPLHCLRWQSALLCHTKN